MNDRRIQRLQEQIKATIAGILLRELADPALGMVTVSRVELDKEFMTCKAFWSVLGDGRQRARTQKVLDRARGFVQLQLGATLHTRTVPRLEFVFDPSIEGAIRIDRALAELRAEREARDRSVDGKATPGGDAPAGDKPDAGG